MRIKNSTTKYKGNINLMISISEIHKILETMWAMNQPKIILPVNNKAVRLDEVGILNLLTCQKGFYNARENKLITNDSEFRVELTKKEYWELA